MIVNEKYFHKGNIALGKTTAQTSTCSGGYSPRAVNGDTRTNWIYGSCTHTCGGTSNWWRVDFGKSSLVHSVKITNRGQAIWVFSGFSNDSTVFSMLHPSVAVLN